MNKVTLWILGLVIVLGGWYLYSSQSETQVSSDDSARTNQLPPDANTNAKNSADPSQTPVPDPNAPVNTSNVASAPDSMNATVTYNDSRFSPSSVTIKKGGTVTFKSAVGVMWVASNPHPSHEGYSGTTKAQHCPRAVDAPDTAFDQCSSGTSYTFTFQKVGSWSYHDHKNASISGVVNVI